MEMVSTITSLITNVVNFAGGLLLLFGAVTLGTNLKDHNGLRDIPLFSIC